jgi:hypothetical protein
LIVPCSTVFNKCDKNAKCTNKRFDVDCECNYGYIGNGEYCDECGVTFATQNTESSLDASKSLFINRTEIESKIIGGSIATQNSWPAQVLILLNYKGNVRLPYSDEVLLLNQTYQCGGTLIDRRTIITAAHCISDTIKFEYDGSNYQIALEPTAYYSTIESMFKVYLGVYDVDDTNSHYNVKSIIKVKY